jgi:hypothetical protein
MRIYRIGRPKNLNHPRRQEAADERGVVRCPRCGAVLAGGTKPGILGFGCHCPVRRVRALAVPA